MVAHSVWQITLLYLLYRLAARLWGRHSALMYWTALSAMAGAAVWAALTFASEWRHYSALADDLALAPLLPAVAPATFQVDAFPVVGAIAKPLPWHRVLLHTLETYAALLGWLWSLGALVFALRMLGGYALSRRMRRVGVSPVVEEWQQKCRRWSRALGIRRPVQWLESVRVSEPLTLGYWKPVVLFPAGLLLQLTPEQVEVLLLHELAHIRRHDYVVNLVQMALETCFFYHPLFWRLSKEARRQREFCCDDMVLRRHPDRLNYAKTLTQLQISSVHLQNPVAMHAIGKSAFAQRILRIAGVDPERQPRSAWTPLLFTLLLTGVALSWSAFTPLRPASTAELVLAQPEHHPANAPALQAPADQTKLAEALPEVPDANALPLPVPDTISPSVVAVEVNKMNVFYIGIDNPITVAVPGYSCEQLTVRLDGEGKLIPQGDCQYIVNVSRPGNVDIAIATTANGREQQLGVKTFRVKRIPDPVVVFDRSASNIIRQKDLGSFFSRPLEAWMQNFDFDASCEVKQFTVACRPPMGDVIEFPVQGNQIPAERLEYIKSMPARSAIYILDVKGKCPGDAAWRNLNDMVFKVVE